MKTRLLEINEDKCYYETRIDYRTWDQLFNSALSLQEKPARVAGFREGHSPANMMNEYYKNHAMQMAVNVVVAEAQKAVMTVGTGGRMLYTEQVLFNIKSEASELVFITFAEAMPVIDIPELEQKQLIRYIYAPSQKDRETYLQTLFEDTQAVIEVDNKSVCETSQVKVSGYYTINTAFTQQPVEFTIAMDGEILQEFKVHLLNHNVGDIVTFDVVYPSNYPNRQFAGKTLHYTLTVQAICENSTIDSIAKLAKMRNISIQELELQLDEEVKEQFSQDVWFATKYNTLNDIIQGINMAVPQKMLAMEMQNIYKQINTIDNTSQTRAPVQEKEVQAIAALKSRYCIFLTNAAQKFNIITTPDDVKEAKTTITKIMSSITNEDVEVIATTMALEEKVIQYILQIAQTSEKIVSSSEIVELARHYQELFTTANNLDVDNNNVKAVEEGVKQEKSIADNTLLTEATETIEKDTHIHVTETAPAKNTKKKKEDPVINSESHEQQCSNEMCEQHAPIKTVKKNNTKEKTETTSAKPKKQNKISDKE